MTENHKEREVRVRLIDACPLCGKPRRSRSGITGTFSTWLGAGGKTYCRCSKSSKEASLRALYQKNKETIHKQKSKEAESIPLPDLGEEFVVKESLGHGGMASVYRVKRVSDGQEFAAKVMHEKVAEDLQLVKRFKLEAKAAESLDHENLIPVYGQGRTADGSELPYLLMGLSKGRTLMDSIKSGETISVSRALKIAEEIGEALIHAHDKGIVHRDVKPSNILLERSVDDQEQVKVVDFGIAKVTPIENRVGQGLTMTGEFFGTPAYMSPEHCLGKSVDERSDIYSLGCVLYEMLAGRPPFWSENPIKVIVSHVNDSPSKFDAEFNVKGDVEKVILKALRKEPDDRYQSMREFLSDIKLLRAGKRVKVKDLPVSKETNTLLDNIVVVAAMVTMLALVALPALMFFPNTFDSLREIRGTRRVLLAGPTYRESVARAREAGGGKVPGDFVYKIKNEFGEVVFSGVGKDKRAAARAAVSGALAKGKSLRGVALIDLDLSDMKLVGVDFSNARMLNVDFSGSDMTRANFSLAKIEKSNFSRAVAREANFSHSVLKKVKAENIRLERSIFRDSELESMIFDGANFKEAGMESATLVSCSGKGTDFVGAKLDSVRIRECNLVNCSFNAADMNRIHIYDSDLSASTLIGCVLSDLMTDRSKFNHCIFDKSIFKNDRQRFQDYSFYSPFNGNEAAYASFVGCDVPEEDLRPGR